MLVRSPDGTTLLLNDVVFNMDRKRAPMAWLITTLLGSAPGPRVSRLFKASVRDRKALRADIERLAAIPDLVRLVVSHDKIASGPQRRSQRRQAATYL